MGSPIESCERFCPFCVTECSFCFSTASKSAHSTMRKGGFIVHVRLHSIPEAASLLSLCSESLVPTGLLKPRCRHSV